MAAVKKGGKVLVIGAGVIGLTTALTLAEHGYRVTVLAREFASCVDRSKITSQVAAAFWTLVTTDDKVKNLCLYGYRKFAELASNSTYTGVYMRERVYVYTHMIDSQPASRELKKNLQKYIPGFRHDRNLVKEKGLSGIVQDAMSIQAPVIETDMFMYWLSQQCISKGVDFKQATVHSLLDNCNQLQRGYQVDWIINCTGVEARKLVQDPDVYPYLGVALMLRREDANFEFPHCGVTMLDNDWHDTSTNAKGSVFFVPRGDHSLWIGTIKLPSDDKNIGINHPSVQRMLQECQAVYPPLANINQDDLHVTVGVRPMREGGVRVERDVQYPHLIHNYGHGSYGVAQSWGSADNVLSIIKGHTLTLPNKL